MASEGRFVKRRRSWVSRAASRQRYEMLSFFDRTYSSIVKEHSEDKMKSPDRQPRETYEPSSNRLAGRMGTGTQRVPDQRRRPPALSTGRRTPPPADEIERVSSLRVARESAPRSLCRTPSAHHLPLYVCARRRWLASAAAQDVRWSWITSATLRTCMLAILRWCLVARP